MRALSTEMEPQKKRRMSHEISVFSESYGFSGARNSTIDNANLSLKSLLFSSFYFHGKFNNNSDCAHEMIKTSEMEVRISSKTLYFIGLKAKVCARNKITSTKMIDWSAHSARTTTTKNKKNKHNTFVWVNTVQNRSKMIKIISATCKKTNPKRSKLGEM